MIIKRGQVWIETVLYTLIGIILIGVVLAFVMPKINEQKDRLIIQQTIESLSAFDQKINAVMQAPGNIREVEFLMKQGELRIDSINDKIIFIIPDIEKPYSEVGKTINLGRMKLITQEANNNYEVRIEIQYSENIIYDKKEASIKFDAVALPYKFYISNEGIVETSGRNTINIRENSDSASSASPLGDTYTPA